MSSIKLNLILIMARKGKKEIESNNFSPVFMYLISSSTVYVHIVCFPKIMFALWRYIEKKFLQDEIEILKEVSSLINDTLIFYMENQTNLWENVDWILRDWWFFLLMSIYILDLIFYSYSLSNKFFSNPSTVELIMDKINYTIESFK